MLKLLGIIVALMLLYVALLACGGVADVSTAHVGASYAAAYVTPGESAELELSTRRSVAGRIEGVSLVAPQWGITRPQAIAEPAVNPVGDYIVRKFDWKSMLCELFVGDPEHPPVRVTVRVPATAPPTGWTAVDLQVCYVLANWNGPGEFVTKACEETLRVPLAVTSPQEMWPLRAHDLAIPASILLGLTLALRIVLRCGNPRRFWYPGLVCLGLAGWFCAGLVWGIWPIQGLLGWTTPWVRILLAVGLLTAAWIAIQMILGILPGWTRKTAASPAPGTS
jgi:hypothetical protein